MDNISLETSVHWLTKDIVTLVSFQDQSWGLQ